MRRAIGRGCTRADFGRSKVGTGPWARKRIWDFEESPLTYAVRTAGRRGAARRSIRSIPNTGSRSPPGSACRCGSPTGSARSSPGGWDEARTALPRPPHPLSAGSRRQDPVLAHAAPSRPVRDRASRRASPTMRPTPPISAALRDAMGGALGEAYVEPRRTATARLAGPRLARNRRLDQRGGDGHARHARLRRPHPGRAAGRRHLRFFRPDGAVRARRPVRPPFVMDFVDFDSVKYADYARSGSPAASRVLHRGSEAAVRAGKDDRRPRRHRPLRQRGRSGLFRARPALPRAPTSARCPTASISTISRPGRRLRAARRRGPGR